MPRDGHADDDYKHTPITLRQPTEDDGSEVWNLIQDIRKLDDNSMYCNLLQCTHFADTCALAVNDGRIVGWMSGYRPPSDPDTLFVWQVAVHPSMRGRGVAKQLIQWVLERPWNADIRHVNSTITSDNKASWALFGAIADLYDAPMDRDPHFERDRHFDGEAPTEHLVQIGPLRRQVAVDVPDAVAA